MPIKVTKQSLPGVLLIEPQVFDDDRGFFLETYHRKKYAEWGIERVFVQDNHSHSQKSTLRGLHYQLQHPQAKLIYVVSGGIFDVAVDIRRGSPTFGQWTGTVLSGENKHQLYVPEGFAHGFCILSETAHVMYKCTDLYAPEDEYGILWSDPSIYIVWPIENPILSKKDSQNPKVREISEDFLPAFKKIG